jgi:type I restriction enzyme S subunit
MSDRSSLQASEQGFTPVDLGEIAHIEMGQSPDSRYVFEDPFLGRPFLQGNAEFGTVSPEPKYSCTRPAKTAKPGDVLISVRAPVGAVNIADQSYCIGRGLAAISVSGVEPSLAAHLICSQAAALRRVAQGTTFEAISKKDLVALKLRMPPQDELPVIAQILDTLDTTIRETEALIDKLKAVKQGLLHDLLTRGIDANGQLRPPQSEAPQLYKESPLGWIPREWDVQSLDNITATPICYGIVQVLDYVPSGVPVLAIRDLLGDYVTGIHRTASSIDAAYPRSRVKPGDVLLSIKGTIGRIGVLPPHFFGNISRDIALIRPTSAIRSQFLAQMLRSPIGQAIIKQAQVGTTRAEISIAPLRKLEIAFPDVREQVRIEEILESADIRLADEQAKLDKLKSQKIGLMDDLLTGRVRVTPLLESVQQAAAQTGA